PSVMAMGSQPTTEPLQVLTLLPRGARLTCLRSEDRSHGASAFARVSRRRRDLLLGNFTFLGCHALRIRICRSHENHGGNEAPCHAGHKSEARPDDRYERKGCRASFSQASFPQSDLRLDSSDSGIPLAAGIESFGVLSPG